MPMWIKLGVRMLPLQRNIPLMNVVAKKMGNAPINMPK